MKTTILFRAAGALALAALSLPHLSAQSQSPDAEKAAADKVAASRTKRFGAKVTTAFYTERFDLSGLPHYAPTEQLTGLLKLYGNNYLADSRLGPLWKEGFSKFHPGIQYDFYLPTGAVAFSALHLGVSNLAMDHWAMFYDLLGFERVHGYEPLEITVVTGAFDVAGWSPALAVIVNKGNPLTKVTIKQLDGIFGSARAGGWDGTNWHPEWSRGPEGDIRTWGQLGLTGEWADKKINTYGFSLRYETALKFSNLVLQAGDKWNNDYRGYGNFRRPDGTTYLEVDQILDHLAADRYGIAYLRYQAGVDAKFQVLDIAKNDGGPYVRIGLDSVHDHSYPLYDEMFFYVDHKPGTKLDPKVREFLKYTLSQEGQEAIEIDGKYLPLMPEVALAQLKKLED